MFENINLEKALHKQREWESQAPDEALLAEYKSILEADWERDERLRSALGGEGSSADLPSAENLDPTRIYDLQTIRKICVKYRLRFLGTEAFTGEIPRQALRKIEETERVVGHQLTTFMIVAPARVFRLQDANKDPLLFAPLNDGRFYLIAKWGKDLAWHRAVMAWPMQSPLHLGATILAFAAVISLCIPTAWLTDKPLGYFNFYRFLAFAQNFTILGVLVAYAWFVLYRKFTWFAWNSKTFN